MGKHIQLFNYSVIFFAPHFGEGTFRSIYIKKIFIYIDLSSPLAIIHTSKII